MSNKDKWTKMVKASRKMIDKDDISSGEAVIWANHQIELYKRSMLALVRANSNWSMGVSDDDEKLIQTMIDKAETY